MLLTYALRRGANGLGVDVNPQGEIVEVVAAGQADADGVARVGDVIVSVDGVPIADCGGMASAMVPGRASYELLVRRSKPGKLETQALAAGLLGAAGDKAGERPPVRLVTARVRRGPNGLGLDLAHFNRVQSIVPGSPAAEDLSVLPGDAIAAVDGVLVGCGQLPPLLAPGKKIYQFLLMRADASAPTAVTSAPAAAAPSSGSTGVPKPAQLPDTLKPRPLTDEELALVLDNPSPKEATPKVQPLSNRIPSPKDLGAALVDSATQNSPRVQVFDAATQMSPRSETGGGNGPIKAKWDFAADDEDDDHGDAGSDADEDADDQNKSAEEQADGCAGSKPAMRRRAAPMGDAIEEGDEEEEEEEECVKQGSGIVDASDSESASGVISLDVLWDVMTCPLAKGITTADPQQSSSSLVSLVQRIRLRLQTACGRGASLGHVIAFGEFGNLLESPIAQALAACGIQVVVCGAPGTCQRGGVGSAMVSAMALRALDIMASRVPSSAQPVLVASARLEVQAAVQELAARRVAVSLAVPLDQLKLSKPKNGQSAANLQAYSWPQMYPISKEDLDKGAAVAPSSARTGRGLTHNAAHTPRPLPAWL